MRTKLALLFLLSFGCFFSSTSLATSEYFPKSVEGKFIYALMKKDEKLARSYLEEGVKIPEIRESTPIRGVSTLPSPRENVKVMMTRYDFKSDFGKSERIAFIWEVTVMNEKITDIRVVYDGANPFEDEWTIQLKLNEKEIPSNVHSVKDAVQQYETKYAKRVLLPTTFPFEINRSHASVNWELLSMWYYNDELEKLLKVSVTPRNHQSAGFPPDYKVHNLKDGTRIHYNDDAAMFEFQKNGLHYRAQVAKYRENQILTDIDLLRIAESFK